MPYLGKAPNFGVRQRYIFTQSSAGATSISGSDDSGATLKFSDGNFVDVYLNGVLLVSGTDYNTNTANTISGLTALASADVIEIIVYDIFAVADTVKASTGGTFSGGLTVAGDVTISGNLSVSGTGAGSVAILSHVTAHNVGGGDLTAGAFRTRPLNTEVDPDGIVTLSSNQFTLAAGTYAIDWTCDGYSVDHHVSQIYDITNSATLILGSASYAKSTVNVANVTYGHHIFTITSTTTYELQHQSSTTKASNGMGNMTNLSGINSTHAFVKITKV